MFWKNLSFPSSLLNNKPNNKPPWNRHQEEQKKMTEVVLLKYIHLRSNSLHTERWVCAAFLDNYKAPLWEIGATQLVSGISSRSIRQREISLCTPCLCFRLKLKVTHKFKMQAVNSLVGTLSNTTIKTSAIPCRKSWFIISSPFVVTSNNKLTWLRLTINLSSRYY